jgi:hypothetical protein
LDKGEYHLHSNLGMPAILRDKLGLKELVFLQMATAHTKLALVLAKVPGSAG